MTRDIGSGNGRAASERGANLRFAVGLAVRGFPLAVAVAVAAMAAAYLVARATPPTYLAHVGLIASQPTTDLADDRIVVPPPIDGAVYRNALLQGGVVSNALERLTGAPPTARELERFLERLTIRIEEYDRSSIVWIEVRDGSARAAADAANLIAEELMIWDRARGLRTIEQSVSAIERSIANLQEEARAAAGAEERVTALATLLESRLSELATARETSANVIVVGALEPLRQAPLPSQPVAPTTLAMTIAAGVLGLLLGYGVWAGLGALDPGIGDRHAMAQLTGLPVLAEFGGDERAGRSPDDEAARFLRAGLDATVGSGPVRTILVTCPTHGAEKDGVAFLLTVSLARSGLRALLIDADQRRPSLTDAFGLVSGSVTGFEEALSDPRGRHSLARVTLDDGSFDFIPSWGTAQHPIDLLSRGFRKRVATWGDAYDIVVLDAPPVLAVADSVVMAPHCTASVMCVSRKRSRRVQLDDALTTLRSADVAVAGTVLTGVHASEGRRSSESKRTWAARMARLHVRLLFPDTGHPVDDVDRP